MKEFRRKLVRIWQMSPGEIAARGAEQFYGLVERLESGRGRTSRLQRGLEHDQALFLLQRARSRPFYFCGAGASSTSLRQAFRSLFPRHTDAIVKEADCICAGSVRLFGKSVTFPAGEVDWHLDWATGERLATTFYRDIATFDQNRKANLKRIWETNRQQFLVTLGKAYFLTRRHKYADCAVRLIETWIQSNPPYQGVNWKEGLEVGLRLLSWIWTFRMLDHTLTEDSGGRILASLALQRKHVARHLSQYSSPNTHLLGEVFALFVLGLTFPELGDPGRSVRHAHRSLELQLERQVGEDGSHREKSAYYHCYALDIFLQATVLGRQYGVEFSTLWMKRVEAMAEFLLAILRPDGSLARFGDDDGGQIVRLGDEDYYRPQSLLALAAVLFKRGDFKAVAGELPEEVFWLFGPDGASFYLDLADREPAIRRMWFPDAKLAVLRSGWSTSGLWLACQEQPMGMLSSGHSHEAMLSFELALGGKAVIVDPGSYTYCVRTPWRDHFRRMEAHNGVQIDWKHWYLPAGPFGWERINAVEPLSPRDWPRQGLRVGYRTRESDGRNFQHIRSFVAESARMVLIHDQFRGAGKHRLTFRLQFAVGCRVRLKEAHRFEIKLGNLKLLLTLEGFGNIQWNIWEGSDDSMAGWVSPRFDQKLPAPTLRIVDEAELPSDRRIWLTVESDA